MRPCVLDDTAAKRGEREIRARSEGDTCSERIGAPAPYSLQRHLRLFAADGTIFGGFSRRGECEIRARQLRQPLSEFRRL